MDPRVQNMFQLCYFSSGSTEVPNGWNVVDEDKTYPLLSSRNPQLHRGVSDQMGYDHDMTNGRAASESSTDEDNLSAPNVLTRMNDASSDEDELAPEAARVSSLSYLNVQNPIIIPPFTLPLIFFQIS